MMKFLIIIVVSLLAFPSLAAPIHDAARKADKETLERLLTADPAKLEAVDAKGQTPLHHAVLGRSSAIVTWLLGRGAAPDPVNRSGQTPLFLALDRGKSKAAQALLNGGADYNKLGRRAIAMAVRTGNSAAISQMIAQGAAFDQPDGGGLTPLVQAVRRGDQRIAKILLQAGANTESQVSSGVPLICWAAANGQEEIVRELVTRGASINTVDQHGRNALDLASSHEHQPVVAYLKTAGLTPTPGQNGEGAQYWLSQTLPGGDAQFWHLGHCGWAVRTQNNILIFDYKPVGNKPEQPGLANGFLSARELAGKTVTVFVTHGHGDHFSPSIYALKDIGATFVYGFKPGTAGCGSEGNYTGPQYIHTPPRTRQQVNGMMVETIASNDLGVGFVVTVDGVTLYHAGDHAGWRDGAKAGYTQEIDYIATLGHQVDVAFLNVTGCHTHGQCPLEDGTSYTLNKLKPRAWFPTHAGGSEFQYTEFAARIAGRNDPGVIVCPTYLGDYWSYHEQELHLRLQ